MGINDDCTDGPGTCQKRNSQRDNGYGISVSSLSKLIRRMLGMADLGMEHGYGHEKNEYAAAHPE